MHRVLFCLALAAGLAVTTSAQDAPRWVTLEGPFDLCEHPDSGEEVAGVNRLRQSAQAKGLAKTATFEVTYTGFTPQAEAAFQAAVDIWASHIESSVPIRVDASFTTQAAGVLGGASAGRVHAQFGAGITSTWYGSPLADALAGRDLCAGTACAGAPDIVAEFASNRSDWYFGTDGNTPSGQFDFVSVVLHELGHGLGFFGSLARDDADSSNGTECTGTEGDICHSFVGLTSAGFPVVFDRFVEDPAGVSILNTTEYPNPSAPGGPLGVLVQSGELFWDSPSVLLVNGNVRAEVYAPNPFQDGSSFAHWDEDQFPARSPNALMTPQIGRRESYQDPGPATCALFQDIGWTLGDGCTRLVVDREPGPLAESGIQIEADGPNPFRQSTALRVRLAEPQTLRAALHDALGREVRVLYDGLAADRVVLRITGDLAPGVYVVRVEGEQGRATASLVRVR